MSITDHAKSRRSTKAVAALPPASSPLAVALDEDAEAYRMIDQAYAAGEAFGASPPDYMVTVDGVPLWVWQGANGGIRAVEPLASGERSYFYRALTPEPYLIAGNGAAYGYDRGQLVAAYDGDGLALASLAASRRVVAAARLLDRGHALHRAIARGRHRPAFTADWAAASAGIDDRRARWRQSLHAQADWRDWHDGQATAQDGLWSQERERRRAYVASLRNVAPLPAVPRPREEPQSAVPAAVAAAAPAAEETARRVDAAEPGMSEPKRVQRARRKARAAAGRKLARAHHPRSHRHTPPYVLEQRPEAQPSRRPPNLFRDVGRFFKRTFGVRVHRGNQAPEE